MAMLHQDCKYSAFRACSKVLHVEQAAVALQVVELLCSCSRGLRASW